VLLGQRFRELIELPRVVEGVVADGGAAEAGEVAAGAEGLAEVAGQAPQIGALAAGDPEANLGPVELKRFDLLHPDGAAGQFDGFAGPGQLVGALAGDMNGRVSRGDLLDPAFEPAGRVGDGGGLGRGGDGNLLALALGVVRGGESGQVDGGLVGFGQAHQAFGGLGGPAEAADDDAGGEGIERAGMAGFDAAAGPADTADEVHRAGPGGLVDDDQTCGVSLDAAHQWLLTQIGNLSGDPWRALSMLCPCGADASAALHGPCIH